MQLVSGAGLASSISARVRLAFRQMLSLLRHLLSLPKTNYLFNSR